MLDIYAIKTDGLRYYVGQCQDTDEAVEASLASLTRKQEHRDTTRFLLIPVLQTGG